MDTAKIDVGKIDEVRHLLDAEGPAHAEMRWIRARCQAGVETVADRHRYRALWLAVTLRRSVCRRTPLSSQVRAAVARWKQTRDEVKHERARAAVEAAFGPDDAPMEGAGSTLPR